MFTFSFPLHYIPTLQMVSHSLHTFWLYTHTHTHTHTLFQPCLKAIISPLSFLFPLEELFTILHFIFRFLTIGYKPPSCLSLSQDQLSKSQYCPNLIINEDLFSLFLPLISLPLLAYYRLLIQHYFCLF